jgi:hypothetical protein
MVTGDHLDPDARLVAGGDRRDGLWRGGSTIPTSPGKSCLLNVVRVSVCFVSVGVIGVLVTIAASTSQALRHCEAVDLLARARDQAAPVPSPITLLVRAAIEQPVWARL